MAERICRNFAPNVFNKNKCQNCYKLREAHTTTGVHFQEYSFDSEPRRSPVAKALGSRVKTVVKSGALSTAANDSLDGGKILASKWQMRWFVLNSAGILECYLSDEQRSGLLDTINLDDCTGMFVGEVDTGEPFSIGIKMPSRTYFLKADNRLEMDNWFRVFRPFIQAAGAYAPRPHRWSSSSDGSITMSEVTAKSADVKVARVHSFGKSSTFPKPDLPPRSSSTHPKTRLADHERATVESLKLQLEKLREENQHLQEQTRLFAHGQDSSHILEQELKTKAIRVKELEKENAKCRDYQKAVIFQEKELQEARGNVRELRQQLEEMERKMKQHQGKVAFHAKELAEARTDLQEANSIISIHKASNEALKGELSSMRQRTCERREKVTSVADEEPESDQALNIESSDSGEAGVEVGQKKDLESKLMLLKKKIKQNERELIIKTRELEKANESRSKVAKYTRSLLQELEAKLGNCEKKLTTTEDELINKNAELDCEQQQRIKLEKENTRLTEEIDKFLEERRKMGLSKEAVQLMNAAKQESDSQSRTCVEDKLEEKLRINEENYSNDRKRLNEEINKLRSALSLAELVVSEKDAKLRDSETNLISANEELDRLRDNSNILKEKLKILEEKNKNILENDNFAQEEFQNTLKDKEEECSMLNQENQDLREENTDLNQKYENLQQQHEELVAKFQKVKESWKTMQSTNENLENEKETLEFCASKLQDQLDNAKENIVTLDDLLDKTRNNWEEEKETLGSQILHLKDDLDDYREKISDLETKLHDTEDEKNSITERFEEDLKVKVAKLRELHDKLSDKEDELRRFNEERDSFKESEEKVTMCEEKPLLAQENEHEEALKLQVLEQEVISLEKECEKYREELAILKNENIKASGFAEEQEKKATYLEGELREYKGKVSLLEHQRTTASENIAELQRRSYALEEQIADYKEKLAAEEERILEYDVEEKLLSAELQKTKREDSETNWNRINELEKKLSNSEDKNKNTEQLLDDSSKLLLSSEEKVVELAEELAQRLKLEEDLSSWIEGVENNLSRTESELCKTKEVLLVKAQDLDNEKTSMLDMVNLSTKYIHDLEVSLAEERKKCKGLEDSLAEEKLKAKEELEQLKYELEKQLEHENRKYEELENCYEEEKIISRTKFEQLIQADSVQIEEMQDKLALSEREQKLQASQMTRLQTELDEVKKRLSQELEDERKYHQKEMKKISDDTFRVSGAANTEVDELKLRLTSRVITLQSDISELKDAHQKEVEKLRTQHKKEVANARKEAILECSVREIISEESEDMSERLRELDRETRDMRKRYEAQMENLKKSHEREMEKVRRSSDSGVELKTEVVQLQSEMERMNEMHIKEIEDMQRQHAKELEQLKQDMATVLQASLTTSPAKQQEIDNNTKKLKARIHKLEAEMEELNKKYNEEINAEREKQQQEIEQTRQDMMMVIQAIRSEKYSLESDVEDEASPNRSWDLKKELEKQRLQYEKRIAVMKEDHRKELEDTTRRQAPLMIVETAENKASLEKRIKELEEEISCMKQDITMKESQHGKEVNQLKSDMLVAIQVARSGSSSPVQHHSDDESKDTITSVGLKLSLEEALNKIEALQKDKENMKKEFKKEKEKSEAATRFGLRRNEEMSNKIYLMQKEMEEVDHKYQKEIQVYKEAFEREKQVKVAQGMTGSLASENEELRVKLEGLELKMEESEALHASEIKIYKDKLGEQKSMDAEEMLYKIKSLEGVIDEMKFEYEVSGKGANSSRENELENRVKDLEVRLKDSNVIHEADVSQSKELKRKVEILEKELQDIKSNQKATKTQWGTKTDAKLREHELKIEELESLLDVKRKRHREEIKELKEKLEVEIQKHTDDSKELRKLQRAISDDSAVSGDYFKRKLDEQRTENRKLREELEKSKGSCSEPDKDIKRYLEDSGGTGYYKRKLEEVRAENRQLKEELEKTRAEQRAESRKLQEELENLKCSGFDDKKSENSTDGEGGGYYKRKFEEQKEENRKLREKVNTLKRSAERRSSASDSDRDDKSSESRRHGALYSSAVLSGTRKPAQENRDPFQFISTRKSASERTETDRKGSTGAKEPLRKTSSDSVLSRTEAANRKPPRVALTSDSHESKGSSHLTRQFSADDSRARILTRQTSKKVETSSFGSIASRVAMYQTAVAKGPDDRAAGKQRKY